jgi:hypothetical protein
MNGDEIGVDCGGSCVKLCQAAFLPPSVLWTKFEKVAPGFYNVASYIVNPNTNGAAVNVPYRFMLYDDRGVLITTAEGVTTLPAHRNMLAFIGAVSTQKRIPAKVVFEFTGVPVWKNSHDTLDGLAITDKKYSEDATGAVLEVSLENRSLTPYENVYVFAILHDAEGNTIGFSRTHIDVVNPGGTEIAPFTWPVSREGKVTTIEVLPLVPPVIDL